jgi:hypothetical protein
MISFEKFAVLAFVASLAGAVYAGEAERHEVIVAVSADDADGKFNFRFDSDDAGFELEDLQVGESRSIVGESGETALITREEDGYRIEVNGKTIEMPLFIEGDHEKRVWVSKDGEKDIDVHVFDAKPHAPEGTVIISGKPIDEATRTLIQSTLESAGHGEGVTFIDAESRDGGEHHVRIFKKHVEKTL